MSFDIKFSGKHVNGSGRIWGYLVHNDEEWFKGNYYSFWGGSNGAVYFQKIKDRSINGHFRKSFKRKQEQYKNDPILHDRVREEFHQLLILKKLKFGYLDGC